MDKPDHGSYSVHDRDVKWDERAAEEVLALPKGLEIKIFAHDSGMNRIDFKLKFPKGYILPRHTHQSWHVVVLTKGRAHTAGGKGLQPGDVIFGWDQPHGPYEFTEESEVFAVMMGESPKPIWNKDEFLREGPKWESESAGTGQETERYAVIYDKDMEWDEVAPTKILTQPKGGGAKIYISNPALNLTVLRRKFPLGYVEPEHVHKSWHSGIVMKGRQCVSGIERYPGDYGFGWDEPHGPFECPDGCEVFAVMVGGGTEHVWDEDKHLRYQAKFKAETSEGKKAVAEGGAARKRELEQKKEQ